MRERRRWFWAIELSLVGPFLCLHFGVGVWGWWRRGERVTGVVVDIDHDDKGIESMTIRDPATEREVTVWPDFDHPQRRLGDTATTVVMRTDPSKVATPADINLYLACWALLGLLAVLWPPRCWRRYGTLATGDFAEFRAALYAAGVTNRR